jgi:hypothetical protein
MPSIPASLKRWTTCRTHCTEQPAISATTRFGRRVPCFRRCHAFAAHRDMIPRQAKSWAAKAWSGEGKGREGKGVRLGFCEGAAKLTSPLYSSANNPPKPTSGALQAQTAALSAIAKATGDLGLEPGQSIGGLPGRGDVVLQNVGGIITTIKPSGQIIITNPQGQIILSVLPK